MLNVREKSKPSGLRFKVRLRVRQESTITVAQHPLCRRFSAELEKARVWLFSTTLLISPEASSQRLNDGLMHKFILYHRGKYNQIEDRVDNKIGANHTDITDGNLIGLRKLEMGMM